MDLYEERYGKPLGCKGSHIHIIEEGDTLYKLSKQYDVRLFDIMRLNPYINVYNLQIGDEICIPISAGDVTEKKYVVKDGDTLANVVKEFGLPLDTVIQYNPGLLNTKLSNGLVLSVPVAMPRVDTYDNKIE